MPVKPRKHNPHKGRYRKHITNQVRETKRLRDKRAWRRLSKSWLAENPLCVMCLANDKIVPAVVTDHIKPHKDNKDLFWDQSNFQSLCKHHHDQKTATRDGGFGRKIL